MWHAHVCSFSWASPWLLSFNGALNPRVTILIQHLEVNNTSIDI